MDELEHFGIKGMKWGIRRTPAQLGHKESRPKLTSSDKWKNEELSKIDKLYNKAYKNLDKDLKRGIDKKLINEKRKELERSHKKDRNTIKRMTYADVEKIRNKRDYDSDMWLAAGLTTAASALKIFNEPLQIYNNLFVTAAINTFRDSMSSPEFQSAAATGYEFIRRFLQ